MSRPVHPVLDKRLSLDSNTFNHLAVNDSHNTATESQSTKKDIFRYSYNLGIQRTSRIQRTSSIGGTFMQQMDGNNLAKVLLARRGLPRSFSMGEELGKRAETLSELSMQENNYQNSEKLQQQDKLTTGNDNTIEVSCTTNEKDSINSNNQNQIVEESKSNELESDSSESKGDCEHRARKLSNLSDSVPDLRSTERISLQREGFSGLFNETELVQSRPICKLRRAARRLGVSLSTDELYHKQRRNGVCNEIDDAAENRKLLRVLNKRF